MSFLVEFPKKKRQKRAKVLRYNAGCEVRWKLWGAEVKHCSNMQSEITYYYNYLLVLIRLLSA